MADKATSTDIEPRSNTEVDAETDPRLAISAFGREHGRRAANIVRRGREAAEQVIPTELNMLTVSKGITAQYQALAKSQWELRIELDDIDGRSAAYRRGVAMMYAGLIPEDTPVEDLTALQEGLRLRVKYHLGNLKKAHALRQGGAAALPEKSSAKKSGEVREFSDATEYLRQAEGMLDRFATYLKNNDKWPSATVEVGALRMLCDAIASKAGDIDAELSNREGSAK